MSIDVLKSRLKWARNKKRYTQTDIANMVGMSPSGYQKLENGQRDPKLDVLVKLCGILDVSSDFLLGLSNSVGYLDELYNRVNKTEALLYGYKARRDENMYRIQELREKMIDSSKDNGLNHETTVEISIKLDMQIERHQTMVNQIKDIESEHVSALRDYLILFLEIPNVIGKEDKLLKRYLPYSGLIQMDLFDGCSVFIYGEGQGSLGYHGQFKTTEEAEVYKEEILRKLNGS